jgi:uncharacterized protein with PQ loop repeat
MIELPFVYSYNEGYAVFMVVVSVVGSLASFVQAYQIWSDKASDAVSILSWAISAITNLFWIFYAIMGTIQDLTLLISCALPCVGSFLVLVLIYVYPAVYLRPTDVPTLSDAIRNAMKSKPSRYESDTAKAEDFRKQLLSVIIPTLGPAAVILLAASFPPDSLLPGPGKETKSRPVKKSPLFPIQRKTSDDEDSNLLDSKA